MTRLIITTDSSTAGAIQRAGLADIVIAIERRLVWGPLPSTAELDAYFAPRTTQPPGLHWLDDTPAWHLDEWGVKDRGLIELASRCESTELWVDPEPNAQLFLLWLLDQYGRQIAAPFRLGMRQSNLALGSLDPEQLAKLIPSTVDLTQEHFALAGHALRAYRAATPRVWFDLLGSDLGLLPSLGQCVVELLDELPNVTSGLGATETRILELIAPGNVQPFDVFPGHQKRNARRVFYYWEVGALLDELARCERPAMTGLDEGPFSLDMHNDPGRFARYKESRLSLTDFGKALLGGDQNFRHHNRIDRWWGGTHLTNEQLWRWDSETRELVAPD